MLRVKDVAARLNLSVAKVYELLDKGGLAHFRFGGAIRVSEEQLQAFIAGCNVETKGEVLRKIDPRPNLKFIR
jgi:excisionase family DNA binding protein